MGLLHLPPDEQKRVRWVMEWIHRMVQRYGGTVYEKETLRTWDWGQALCRECYGPDWNNVISERGIETPSWEDIGRAQRWEDGELPDWFANEEEDPSTQRGKEEPNDQER